MTTTDTRLIDETRIRQLSDDWTKALSAKDVHALMAAYAPDVVVFDLAPPLRFEGTDIYRQNLEDWFASFQGPIGYETRDWSIHVGDEVAFSHSLNRITGTRTNGEKTDVWVRATVGYLKRDGKWMIAHEHFSTPFEMEPPYKALLDLKP